MSAAKKTGSKLYKALLPFLEKDELAFHGRARETANLTRLIVSNPATVLFGISGVGKTSLVRAGVFPELRKRDVLPVPIRLLRTDRDESPLEVVRQAIGEALVLGDCDAPPPKPDETLWEYFHQTPFWTSDDRLLTPVLVLDQFEELFTRWSDSPGREPLHVELADLVENTVPKKLEKAVLGGAEKYDFDISRRRVRILFSLREDYLPDFHDFAATMPSIGKSRFRLRELAGDQALYAVRLPARELMSREVAEAIVRFVGSDEAGSSGKTTPLANLEIEPSFLSLFCSELDLSRGSGEFTEDLVREKSKTRFFEEFYEDCLKGEPRQVQLFIEDKLLTERGKRRAESIEEAKTYKGVDEEVIEGLVTKKRLLREIMVYDERHLELVHDRIAGPVQQKRDERRARRQQWKKRWLLIGGSVLLLVLLSVAGLIYTYVETREQKEIAQNTVAERDDALADLREKSTELSSALERAKDAEREKSLKAKELTDANADLTKAIEETETAKQAADRAAQEARDAERAALAAEAQTNRLKDQIEDQKADSDQLLSILFSSQGRRLLMGGDQEAALVALARSIEFVPRLETRILLARALDGSDRRSPGTDQDPDPESEPPVPVLQPVTVRKWATEATLTPEGVIRIRDTNSGQEVNADLPSSEKITALAFARGGRVVAVAPAEGNVLLFSAETGRRVGVLRLAAPARALACGGKDGQLLAATLHDRVVFWHLSDPDPIRVIPLHGPTGALAFHSDGSIEVSVEGMTEELRPAQTAILQGGPEEVVRVVREHVGVGRYAYLIRELSAGSSFDEEGTGDPGAPDFSRIRDQVLLGGDIDRWDAQLRRPLHLAVAAPSETAVRMLLEAGADANARDYRGETPLHYAARVGSPDIAKLLLESGASLHERDRDLNTPLHIACDQGRLAAVRTLFHRDLLEERNSAGATPLYSACAGEADTGDLPEIVAYLRGKSADLEVLVGRRRWTPLWVAASLGRNEIVEALREGEGGAEVNPPKAGPGSPLHSAVSAESATTVGYLIEERADLNLKDAGRRTPIHIAASLGHSQIVERILRADQRPWVTLELNVTDGEGSTPLLLAARAKSKEIVVLLAGHQAADTERVDLDITNGRRRTPLHEAIVSDAEDVAEYLIDEKAKVATGDDERRSPLHDAAARGFEKIVRKLIAAGAGVDTHDSKRSTPLHEAAMNGDVATVQALLEEGADVESQDVLDRTALHICCIKDGRSAAAKAIIAKTKKEMLSLPMEGGLAAAHLAARYDRGEILELLGKMEESLLATPDENESTPLHYAVKNAALGAVKVLLDAGVPIEVRDRDGLGPIHHAARQKDPRLLRKLLDAEADVDFRTKSQKPEADDGWTALHFAAEVGNQDIVTALFLGGAQAASRDGRGRTALHVCILNDHSRAAEEVLKHHQDLSVQANDGLAAAHLAARLDRPRIIELLAEIGGEELLETPDKNGLAPLHHAVRNRAIDAMRALLKLKVETEVRGPDGLGPIHLAARLRDVEPLTVLLKGGAKVDYETKSESEEKHEWTALHFAASEGNAAAAAILLKFEADRDKKNESGETPEDLAEEGWLDGLSRLRKPGGR